MSVVVTATRDQRSLSESFSGALASMSRDGQRTSGDPAAALNQFLLGVEQRAFAMTVMAVRNREDALDIVQDAMLQLAEKYANRPSSEWAPLFFRILRNRTTDHHRRNTRSRGIFGWFDRLRTEDSEDTDPLEDQPGSRVEEPAVRVESDGSADAIAAAVSALPERQREAFLLRSWEGLDVAATAEVMGCSAGSVKTHHFRALAALRQQLGDHWIDQEAAS
ncbi:MAG: RNA polymerase sigma factor [Pseudomonadota bacterium]